MALAGPLAPAATPTPHRGDYLSSLVMGERLFDTGTDTNNHERLITYSPTPSPSPGERHVAPVSRYFMTRQKWRLLFSN